MSVPKQGTRLLAFLDAGLWYAYLMALVTVSFVNQQYPETYWLAITALIYTMVSLVALSSVFGGPYNWAALHSARYSLVVFSLILVYLFLQQITPYHTEAHRLLVDHSTNATPSWFQPDLVWSIVPNKTRVLMLSELLMFGVLLLSLALISTRKRVLSLIYVIAAVCFVHALVGVATKFSGLSLVDLKFVDGHFSAARAWFINRNHFAAFISLCFVGVLSLQFKLIMTDKAKPASQILIAQLLSPRIIYLVFISMALLALVVSESRAGFLAIFVSLTLVLLSVNEAKNRFGQRRFIFALMLLIAAFTLTYFGSDLLSRFGTNGEFLGERTTQWALTWSAIQAEWLLGYGGNSYATVFQIVRDDNALRHVVFDQAHNDYLHIWLEQGLIGLALWIAFLVLSMRAALSSLRATSSSLTASVTLAGIIVIVAALIQSLVDFNLHILNIRYYFFVIMALVIAAPVTTRRKRRSNKTVRI